jgi:hypothetical protein
VTVKVGAGTVPERILAGEVHGITDVAGVCSAAIGGGQELDIERPLADVKRMDDGVGFLGMVGVALGATIGAGAEILSVLLSMGAVSGRSAVTGITGSAGNSGAPPGWGQPFKVTIDIVAARQAGGRCLRKCRGQVIIGGYGGGEVYSRGKLDLAVPMGRFVAVAAGMTDGTVGRYCSPRQVVAMITGKSAS